MLYQTKENFYYLSIFSTGYILKKNIRSTKKLIQNFKILM